MARRLHRLRRVSRSPAWAAWVVWLWWYVLIGGLSGTIAMPGSVDSIAITSDPTTMRSETTAMRTDSTAMKIVTTTMKSETTTLRPETAMMRSETTQISEITSTITETPGSTSKTPDDCEAPPNFMSDFHLSKLISENVWYEVQRSADSGSSVSEHCPIFKFRPDQNDYGVQTTIVVIGLNDGNNDSLEETKIRLRAMEPLLQQSFGNLRTTDGSMRVWIMNTDYTNFLVAVVCSANKPLLSAIVLSSQPKLTDVFKNRTVIALLAANIGLDTMQDSRQDCPALGPGPGCEPPPITVRDFAFQKYVGSWNVALYSKKIVPDRCTSHVFSLEGHAIAFFQRYYHDGSGLWCTYQRRVQLGTHGHLYVTSPPSDDEKMNYCLSPPSDDEKMNYWVVDTDYVRYSVVYTCTDLPFGDTSTRLLLLTRDTFTPSADVVVKAQTLAQEITGAELVADRTDRCVPAVCPQNPTVAKFIDMARFAGTWYQVKVSDMHFMGSCVQYLHTETYNSSVFIERAVGESLDIWETVPAVRYSLDGRYVFASVDSDRGRRYNVIDTDYGSWAIVSSCVENPPVPMKEYTAILSRYKTLSPKTFDEVCKKHPEVTLMEDQSWDSCEEARCPQHPVGVPGPPGPPGPSGPLGRQDKPPIDWDALGEGQWSVIQERPTATTSGFCTMFKFYRKRDRLCFDIVQWLPDIGAVSTRSYEVKPDEGGDSRRFQVSSSPPSGDFFDSLWILDTDHKNYVVIYSCPFNGARNEARTWVLGHGHGPASLSSSSATLVLDALIRAQVDVGVLRAVDHEPGRCNVVTAATNKGVAAKKPSAVLVFLALAVVGSLTTDADVRAFALRALLRRRQSA